MAMSLLSQRVSLLRFKALLSLKRFAHSKADSSLRLVTPQIRPVSTARQSNYDQSKWKKLDARQFGISEAMIPPHARDVLKVLRGEGFSAYLVGGCVRDLVLNRIPKDFDVITTAKLEKVKSIFQRAVIVGQHFPICKVHIKGAVVEVSSFETRSRDAKDKKMNLVSSKSGDFGKKDVRLWRDAMSRDFTINSLFLDPCGKRKIIYDYTNAMDDLKSLKLETLIRAKLSFTKDCARILRGVRIAARLGLTLSKEIEIAVHSLGSSTNSLHKNRLLMEFDYMLSYGAAEPSLHLLWRFGLVKWLLPRHSAYLDKQTHTPSSRGTLMLIMRLFANMDKLVSCDRPSNSCVWVALLGFHLAVMKNTQDALVIWAFASILYEGSWKQGVCIAKQHAGCQVNLFPEIRRSSDYTSQKLAQKIRHLASLVTDSVTSLCYSVSKHKEPSRSGWPFISKKVGGDSVEIFKFLEDDLESYNIKRVGKKIDYAALQKGSLRETRFVIGKIIFETMKGGIVGESQDKEVIHDVANQNEMYNLVERKEHPVLSRKVEEKKKGADPEAKQEQEQAIRTEIVEANVNYKQKLLTEKNKVSVLSRQVEDKMKEAGTVAKQEQAIRTKIEEANVNYEQKLLTEKNKRHVLSRKVEEKKEAGPEAKQEQAIRAEIVEANVKYKQKLLTEKNKAPVLSRQVEEKKKETALEAKREQAIPTELVEAKGKYTQKVINEKKKVHVLSRLFR